jgi:hypothetical protein
VKEEEEEEWRRGGGWARKDSGEEGERNKRKTVITPPKKQTDRRGDPRGAGSAAAAQPPTPPRLATGHYIKQSKSSHGSSHGGARALAELGPEGDRGLTDARPTSIVPEKVNTRQTLHIDPNGWQLGEGCGLGGRVAWLWGPLSRRIHADFVDSAARYCVSLPLRGMHGCWAGCSLNMWLATWHPGCAERLAHLLLHPVPANVPEEWYIHEV